MTTENNKKNQAEAITQLAKFNRQAEHTAFMYLFRDYADILYPHLPDTGGGEPDEPAAAQERGLRFETLHRSVYSSAYLTQFNRPELLAAFNGLERLLAEARGVPVSLDSVGEKERQVCFLHRFAQIIRWPGYQRIPPDPKALSRARKRISAVCISLDRMLLAQLEDENLVRELHNNELDTLPEFMKTLRRLSDVFKTIKPRVPYERNRDSENSVLRLILHDIAECCYRIYEVCDYEVVRHLLKSCWLNGYAAIGKEELSEMIASSLERKLTAYDQRNSELWDDHRPPDIPWRPVQSL